jgi:TipAS antibiotic-recognition protein
MTMIEKHYTPDQLAALEQRPVELGEAAIADAEREWAELIAAAETERAAGSDPAAPAVRELARRWLQLVERFTGGDSEVEASLKRMYEKEGPESASHGLVSPELMAYMVRAMDHARAGGSGE